MFWKKILTGGNHSSNEIQEEIKTLSDNRQQLEAKNTELETSLQKLQIDLLAEAPGAAKSIRNAESEISQNGNKIAAISNIIEDLEKKFNNALVREKNDRQSEITSEIEEIDKQATEARNELVKAYARAAALYINLTGRRASELSFDYFLDYKLDLAVQC